MNIIKLTQIGQNLYFTAIDKNGKIKIGIQKVSQAGRRKPEWFEGVLCQK